MARTQRVSETITIFFRDGADYAKALISGLTGRFIWWGGCGVFRCPDCRPRFGILNRELPAKESD